MIEKLTLRGVLSFGHHSDAIELRALNVLVGPNGSGKSNIIELISLMRSSAMRFGAPMMGTVGGGVKEWIWKGDPQGVASIEAVLSNINGKMPLRHRIAFASSIDRFALVDEVIENDHAYDGHEDVLFYYRFLNGRPMILANTSEQRGLRSESIRPDESILSQRKDPEQYPVLAYIDTMYSRIKIFREWHMGRNAIFRLPQSADMPGDTLLEDFSNLGLFLSHLRGNPRVKRELIQHMRDLFDGLDDVDIRVKGGAVEVYLSESDYIIPANRLSDGTLRYLCLLAILCDPDPPPLICIEEPELGMHPDLIPKIADLLLQASERTQLIVTTHSDILINALTESPESVLIVERGAQGTTARRLGEAELQDWLGEYRLGKLWLMGALGGTRW